MQASAPLLGDQNQEFSLCYEEIRHCFESFASNRGLKDQISTYLVAKIASHFNHVAYFKHMTLDDATLVSDKLNLDIVHTGTDYYFDNQDHKAKVALEGHRR